MVSDQLLDNMMQVIRSSRGGLAVNPKSYTHPASGTRAKDLVKILWALSCLVVGEQRLPTAHQIADVLVPQLEAAWDLGHFFREADSCHLMSDALLSLACWNIYPARLIDKVIVPPFDETC